MDGHDAHELLADAECVEFATGTIGHVKQLRDRCLGAEIPASIGPVESGDPYRAVLVIRESDAVDVARLMQAEWLELVQQEGTVEGLRERLDAREERGEGQDDEDAEDGDQDGEPPCPACGTAAPLVDGACSDCGLNLA